MIAIKNVLLATDFSEASSGAIAYARDFARSYGATLHFVHVVDDIRWRYSLDMTPVDMSAVQASLEAAAMEQMAALVTDDDRKQLRARTSVSTASVAADAVVQYAAREGVDLIVIGTHGRTGVRRLFMGSVADRIVRLSTCPVLAVPGTSHPND